MTEVLEEGEDVLEGEDVVLGGFGGLGGVFNVSLILGD